MCWSSRNMKRGVVGKHCCRSSNHDLLAAQPLVQVTTLNNLLHSLCCSEGVFCSGIDHGCLKFCCRRGMLISFVNFICCISVSFGIGFENHAILQNSVNYQFINITVMMQVCILIFLGDADWKMMKSCAAWNWIFVVHCHPECWMPC
jgi:hypothetical protein